MEDEGYCYYDTDHDTPPAEPTWVEIVRTGVSYGTIIYAVPNQEEIQRCLTSRFTKST